METIGLIILLAFVAMLALVFMRNIFKPRLTKSEIHGEGMPDHFQGATLVETVRPAHHEIYEIANRLEDFFNIVAHPRELEAYPIFKEGVRLLSGKAFKSDEITRFAVGDHIPISCMAFQAMRQRSDTAQIRHEIVFGIGTFVPYQHYFALRYLAEVTPDDEPLIGRVLGATTPYMTNRLSRSDLEELIRQRKIKNETLEFDEEHTAFLGDEGMSALRRFLSDIDPELGLPLLESIDHDLAFAHRRQMPPLPHDDPDILYSTGRIWAKKDAKSAGNLLIHDDVEKTVGELMALLTARRSQSVLLTGESGIGKTTIQRILARQLYDKGWTIFIAGHSDLLAGQTYIGQLEQRLKQVIEKLRTSKKIIWHIPNIDRLVFTGTHQHSTFSVLDAILPFVADGSLRIMADCLPSAYDRMVQIQPRVPNAMAVCPVNAVSREDTLDIAAHWLDLIKQKADEELLPQAWDLAQQYLGGRAAPGNVMDLVKSTAHRLSGNKEGKNSTIGINDLILTLSQQTGLPMDVLDVKRDLDLDDLDKSLSSRVIGQDEAVQCLVDRVAMIKAGIADPEGHYG